MLASTDPKKIAGDYSGLFSGGSAKGKSALYDHLQSFAGDIKVGRTISLTVVSPNVYKLSFVEETKLRDVSKNYYLTLAREGAEIRIVKDEIRK